MDNETSFRKKRIFDLRQQLKGFEVVSILKQLGASNAAVSRLTGVSAQRVSKYTNKAAMVAELNMHEAHAARNDPHWPYE